jgi:Ca2+-transporting ATPase
VIRNGQMKEIRSEELVIGDSLVTEEGTAIAADAVIVHSNDFSVNESILTGEPYAVYKDSSKSDNAIYAGTNVASGLAIATITAIANETRLSRIGKMVESLKSEKTPLELKINDFVKKMVIAGAIVFLVVWGINFFHSYNVLDSLLKALTLAMSILPEEIPVAFTTFMALGAWRLLRMGIVVKQIKTVETLGSATVICTDKTGTITENKMKLAKLFLFPSQKFADPADTLTDNEKELIRLGMWSSEPIPFDPMETALHESYARLFEQDERPGYKLIHEYPIGGKPPMMTHIFESGDSKRIVAAKGAPEALMNVSNLTAADKEIINTAINKLAIEGFRVLGVGVADFSGNDFPATQQEFAFQFKGIVAFYDPPKKNIQQVFEDFQKAGINVKIITGDYEPTTIAIAKQINFTGYEKTISGDELMKLSTQDLEKAVISKNIFTRMFPEAS